jgi:primosomal replication protein N
VPADGEPNTNRLTLDATLLARDPLRYTPAGIAALDCTLRHQSQQREAGGERRVDFEVHGVAFAEVARSLCEVPMDRALRCEGFLARRYRTGTTLALHITRFTELG